MQSLAAVLAACSLLGGFVFFLLASPPLGWARISPTHGLAPAGPPQGCPDLPTENVDIPSEVLECQDKYTPVEVNGVQIWTFEQIAGAFYEYSVKPWNFPNSTNASSHVGECVAALVIVAGECQTTSHLGASGCLKTNDFMRSGIYQTDFLRTGGAGAVVNPQIEKDGGIMNLCVSSYGAGFMVAPFPVGNSSEGDGGNRVNTLQGGSYFTCRGALADVGAYDCPDLAHYRPQAIDTYANFIGPFCHKGWESHWVHCQIGGHGGCCAVWNGGANLGRDLYPFPRLLL